MRSTLASFVCLFMLGACSNAPDKAPAAPGCGDDAAVATDTGSPIDTGVVTDAADASSTSPAPEALTWSVEFPTGGKLGEIPAITFRGAFGLVPAPTEVTDTAGTSVALTISPFEGYGGDTKDATALASWYARVLAWTPCDGCDATREWIKVSAELVRPAVVSAQTKDGEWLARWTMADAWPSDYFGGKRKDGGFEVASLSLAGAPTTFEINPNNPWLARALKSAGIAPTKLPDAAIGFGKAPDFATAALARPFLGVDGLVSGLSRFATSTPLYSDSGASGESPLFEPTDRRILPPTIEIREGATVLLRAVGIKREIETMEWRSSDSSITRKRPGRTKYKNIVMRRADVVDPSAISWLDSNLSGKGLRKSGSVILTDRMGDEVLRVTAVNAALVPMSAVPATVGPTDWIVPEASARWQRQGIGHTIVVKLVADAIETK